MRALISYDDTLNDQDALAFARVLASGGAELTLAYVRHRQRRRAAFEELDRFGAEELLENGARWLGDLDVARRVIVDASTGAGLGRLAAEIDADLVVFGSDYRTAAGRVAIGGSAERLLETGRAALGLAPAAYRAGAHAVRRIGVLDGGDPAAVRSAEGLADTFGAALVPEARDVDLLVVASRPEARPGQTLLSARSRAEIERARCPVIVLARGIPLRAAALVPDRD